MLKGFLSAITLMATMFVLFASTASASGGGCPQMEGFAIDLDMWYTYGECEYSPLIPDELFCTSDADCVVDIDVSVVEEDLAEMVYTCHVLSAEGDPIVGICRPTVVRVECCAYGADETTHTCNQPSLCVTNTDCAPGVCWANECVKPYLTEVCKSDFDCRYSKWGPFCVKDSYAGNGLCQECRPPSLTILVVRSTIAEGCYSDRRKCEWGMYGWSDVPRSTYYCE